MYQGTKEPRYRSTKDSLIVLTSLLDLRGQLVVDAFQDLVGRRALHECRQLRGHGSIGFTGVHAVVHARDLGHPVAEALPDLVATEERIGCGVGLAAARSGQR